MIITMCERATSQVYSRATTGKDGKGVYTVTGTCPRAAAAVAMLMISLGAAGAADCSIVKRLLGVTCMGAAATRLTCHDIHASAAAAFK